MPASDGPYTQQQFQQANRFGRGACPLASQDPSDDQTMTRDSIENLAIQPVENPYRSNSDLDQKVKPFGLEIKHRYCLTECPHSCNCVPNRPHFPRSLKYGVIGARGRIRTCTGDALNVVSLLLDYASCWRRAKIGSSSR